MNIVNDNNLESTFFQNTDLEAGSYQNNLDLESFRDLENDLDLESIRENDLDLESIRENDFDLESFRDQDNDLDLESFQESDYDLESIRENDLDLESFRDQENDYDFNYECDDEYSEDSFFDEEKGELAESSSSSSESNDTVIEIEDSTCLICLENINHNTPSWFIMTKGCQCNVEYHPNCFLTWYQMNGTCPICHKRLNLSNIYLLNINNNYIIEENLSNLLQIEHREDPIEEIVTRQQQFKCSNYLLLILALASGVGVYFTVFYVMGG
ncbi:hypothetical protein CPAV1605_1144 [seawater metagenome]|uniref:RING-type domain-containing protein n=1 Tax=seawater metagenome TaxID=1561972 RepID=A0A5E8CJ29_9ZZZZ